MRRLGWLLAASALCCGRTSPLQGVAGTGGTLATAGVIATGGVRALGGAAGGVTSAPDGSLAAELDTCVSDADCRQCNWGTAPTDADHCTGYYCCGGTILSKRRCEANQAAWADHCPGRSPEAGVCPCVMFCPGQAIACVGGRCGLSCPPVDAALPDTALDIARGFDAASEIGRDVRPYCGDGIVNGAEECDNGKNEDDYALFSGCGPGCKLPIRCGDGIVQPGYDEQCDYGAGNSQSTDPSAAYGTCMANCHYGGWCGDGKVNGPEQCDDGANDGTYRTCNPDCTIPPYCGDGIVQPEYGEECEPTGPNDPNCTSVCRKPDAPCCGGD